MTEPVTLADCPPGHFIFEGTLCFKSEYRSGKQSDAYCCGSGEYFAGGVSGDIEAREALLVMPVEVVISDRLVEARKSIDDLAKSHEKDRAEWRGRSREYDREIGTLKVDLDRVRDQLARAREAACEMRGMLREARSNQMVRRGDIPAGVGGYGVPTIDFHDDGVPF